MIFAGVSLRGRCRLTIVDDNAKVDANYYIDNILKRAIVDCRSQIGEGFIFMQDGAPSHTAGRTQQYLEANAPGFISKNQWPANSPDLNPMDYGIWQALSEIVYKQQILSADQLKTALKNAWNRLSQRFIAKTIRQFRHRLQLTVDVNGGHFEHLLE